MTPDPKTHDLLREGVRRLPPELTSPALDAEVLLAHVLGVPRAHVRSHSEETRTAAERARYVALLERRARGEPLAYILGYKDFWSLRLAVTPAVLVPRPETELLVERALALAPREQARVVDIGTGSGAIALALARERPGWQIVATELSAEALDVARRNAADLAIDTVEFLQGDGFAPLAGRRFDVLLSNPPYVGDEDPVLSAPPLRFEPRVALTPGADAMACLSTFIGAAPRHLERGGWLLLEHGALQAAAVARELVARGFAHVRSHRDLAGHERITEASWNERMA